ncbi:hypothetical protein ACJX0J_041414, partial [Zea mays]
FLEMVYLEAEYYNIFSNTIFDYTTFSGNTTKHLYDMKYYNINKTMALLFTVPPVSAQMIPLEIEEFLLQVLKQKVIQNRNYYGSSQVSKLRVFQILFVEQTIC